MASVYFKVWTPKGKITKEAPSSQEVAHLARTTYKGMRVRILSQEKAEKRTNMRTRWMAGPMAGLYH